jgi:hypothetical protein
MTVLDAAHALRSYPIFRGTSLRHLTDLVELARRDQRTIGPGQVATVERAAFILVLSGTARVAPAFTLRPGEVFWTTLFALAAHAMNGARPGHVGLAAAPAPIRLFVVDAIDVPVEATSQEEAFVLPLTEALLHRATRASLSFGRSVDLSPLGARMTLHEFFTDRYGRAFSPAEPQPGPVP